MKLADINKKYEGRPIDMAKWRFSGIAKMGSIVLAVNDVELDDGCFYDFRATIKLDWSGKPSDIVRHGNYGVFAGIFAVSVSKNGEKEHIENSGDIFADAIDTLIAPAFGLEPSTEAKAIVVRNDVCPWDYPNHNDATREECDRAWETIKRELVHYTARKFNLPEPQDLSEKPEDYPFTPPLKANFNKDYPLDNLLAYRMMFEVFFCGQGRLNPSWSRSQAWVNLRNAMLDEMFDRVGVDLPTEAHSLPYMYNGRKPETWKRLLPKKHWNIENDNENLHYKGLKFPFDLNELEAGKAEFLKHDEWRAIYDAAPEGAKRRLELSFWFSHVGGKKIADEAKKNDATTLMAHRDYQAELENHMSIKDLTFMVESLNKEGARKHYRRLIEAKNNPNSRYMTYDQFFKLVRDQGEYKVHKYSNDKKQAILKDFLSSVAGNHDPLEAKIEDIFVTAKVREVRTYPANGWVYLRMLVRLLDGDAKWGESFQIAALMDSHRQLRGYTFTESGMIFEFHPKEINGKETEAQRSKRQELRKHRESMATENL